MDDLRQSLAELIVALAVKELALASVLNALADKIDRLDCRDADCRVVLATLRDLVRETLRLSVERGKTDSGLLQTLLAGVESAGAGPGP